MFSLCLSTGGRVVLQSLVPCLFSPPPGQDTPWTGYATGDTPLAVTQEEFLVS